MFYYAVIAFQAFCMFHVYKSRNENYWYFIIFFVPIIGATIYTFTQIINKKNLKAVANKITLLLHPRKKINKLKIKLEKSETFQNKVNLADAYREKKEYSKAILYYEEALGTKFRSESYTINKALKCYFALKNYKQVVFYGSKIDLDKNFRGSLCMYAISLEKCGNTNEAEHHFKKVDKRYTNYVERLEFSKFLIRQQKNENATILLNEIIGEIDNMLKNNKIKHKYIYKEAKQLKIKTMD